MNLSFDPSIRDYKKNLEMLNAALDTMLLSDIEITKVNGYTATTQKFNKVGEVTSTLYSFGFDKIEIICMQKPKEELHIFQIDVAAFPKEKAPDTQELFNSWRKEHPDRKIRQIICYSFGKNIGFILVHYENKEKKKEEEK